MAISASDVKTYLSGGASNSDVNASLGGAKSSTAWTGGTLHDLFDVVTGDENAASDVEYRCVYIQNGHGSLATSAGKLWIQSQVSGGATLAIGLDPAGKNATAATAANENTAPAGVSFSAPTDKASGLSMPDLSAGDYIGVWFRRTAANSAALDADGATVRFAFDSPA